MHLPGILSRNLRLKLVCIGLSGVVWAGVVYAANPPETRVISVHVPQDAASLPARYLLVHAIPDVQVLISGTRENLEAFDSRSLVVKVDYAAIHGTGRLTLPVIVTVTDPNVELGGAPTDIVAEVDTLDSLDIPVNLVVNPPPPMGYIVSGQSLDPQKVTITGPHNRLSSVRASIQLDLSNQKTNLDAFVPVRLQDTKTNATIGNLGVTPPTVRVILTIAPVETSRASAVVPETVGSVATGYQLVGISVDPPTVVISGPRDLLNALDSLTTQAISLTNLNSDTTVTIKLAPPAGVRVSPDTVTVHLKIIALPVPSPTPTPTPP